MQTFDAIVVGGGPAGSTCAWKLQEAGVKVAVLDRCRFPRTKLCAGWITPQVVEDLELDVAQYPYRFLTFEKLVLHWRGLRHEHACRQHSIRRFEFDHFLLERAGAPVFEHNARRISRENGAYVVDDAFRCRYLIGAAGTACPVYRAFFRDASPRVGRLQTATYEHEFAYDWQDGECHLWFFGHGLPGYAWYVPKADGYINIGLGGMAQKLKGGAKDIRDYWRLFSEDLEMGNLVRDAELAPKGYSYFLRGSVDTVRLGNAYLVGDAVGLATVDLCEGIGPAVQSALLAAESIVGDGDYSLEELTRRSAEGLFSRFLSARFTGTLR